MERDERLAREAVIITKNGLMNLMEVARQADKTLEKHDPDEIAVAEALVKLSSAASVLIQLIQRKNW